MGIFCVKSIPTWLLVGGMLTACQSKNTASEKMKTDSSGESSAPLSRFPAGTFGYDLDFLKKNRGALVLTAPDNDSAQVAVVPALQGRVMTSTLAGPGGDSFGWLNHDLLSSTVPQPHIHAYGGEERFWLAPEGGQFSVFFGPGDPFDFAHWQTPALIDTVAFEVKEATKSKAVFTQKATLTNHSGTRFDFDIRRTIRTLGSTEVATLLKAQPGKGLRMVAYESENVLTNTGEDWQREKGLLAVWILGMFKASDRATIVVPVQADVQRRVALTDDYFGKVPADRLKVKAGVVYFKADGQARNKIGVAPGASRGVAGSFDGRVLTLIQFDLDPPGDYLSSAWEHHKNPYAGDAFNSYNDGLNAEGNRMGTLYELESTSAAKALKKGERLVHRHRTVHLSGERPQLDALTKAVLGVSLAQIEEGLK